MSLEAIELTTLASGQFCWTGDYCPLKFALPCQNLVGLYLADDHSVTESISFSTADGEHRVQNWADRRGSSCKDGFGTLSQSTSENAPYFKTISSGGRGVRFDGKSWLTGQLRNSVTAKNEFSIVFAGFESNFSNDASRPIFSFRGDDQIDLEVATSPLSYGTTQKNLHTVPGQMMDFSIREGDNTAAASYSIVLSQLAATFYRNGVKLADYPKNVLPTSVGVLDFGCRLALNIAAGGKGNSIQAHEDTVPFGSCFNGSILGFAAYDRAITPEEVIEVGTILKGDKPSLRRPTCAPLGAPVHGVVEKVANKFGEVDQEGASVVFKCHGHTEDEVATNSTRYMWQSQSGFPQFATCDKFGRWPGFLSGVVPACVEKAMLDILDGKKVYVIEDLTNSDILKDFIDSILGKDDPTLNCTVPPAFILPEDMTGYTPADAVYYYDGAYYEFGVLPKADGTMKFLNVAEKEALDQYASYLAIAEQCKIDAIEDEKLGCGRGYGLDDDDCSDIILITTDPKNPDGPPIACTQKMWDAGVCGDPIDLPDVATNGCAAVNKLVQQNRLSSAAKVCNGRHTFASAIEDGLFPDIIDISNLGLSNPAYAYAEAVSVLCAATCQNAAKSDPTSTTTKKFVPVGGNGNGSGSTTTSTTTRPIKDLVDEVAPCGWTTPEGLIIDCTTNLPKVPPTSIGSGIGGAPGSGGCPAVVPNTPCVDYEALFKKVAPCGIDAQGLILTCIPVVPQEYRIPKILIDDLIKEWLAAHPEDAELTREQLLAFLAPCGTDKDGYVLKCMAGPPREPSQDFRVEIIKEIERIEIWETINGDNGPQYDLPFAVPGGDYGPGYNGTNLVDVIDSIAPCGITTPENYVIDCSTGLPMIDPETGLPIHIGDILNKTPGTGGIGFPPIGDGANSPGDDPIDYVGLIKDLAPCGLDNRGYILQCVPVVPEETVKPEIHIDDLIKDYIAKNPDSSNLTYEELLERLAPCGLSAAGYPLVCKPGDVRIPLKHIGDALMDEIERINDLRDRKDEIAEDPFGLKEDDPEEAVDSIIDRITPCGTTVEGYIIDCETGGPLLDPTTGAPITLEEGIAHERLWRERRIKEKRALREEIITMTTTCILYANFSPYVICDDDTGICYLQNGLDSVVDVTTYLPAGYKKTGRNFLNCSGEIVSLSVVQALINHQIDINNLKKWDYAPITYVDYIKEARFNDRTFCSDSSAIVNTLITREFSPLYLFKTAVTSGNGVVYDGWKYTLQKSKAPGDDLEYLYNEEIEYLNLVSRHAALLIAVEIAHQAESKDNENNLIEDNDRLENDEDDWDWYEDLYGDKEEDDVYADWKPAEPQACHIAPHMFVAPGLKTVKDSLVPIKYGPNSGKDAYQAIVECDNANDYFAITVEQESLSCSNATWALPTQLRCMKACKGWDNKNVLQQDGLIASPLPTSNRPGSSAQVRCGLGFITSDAVLTLREGKNPSASLHQDIATCSDKKWTTARLECFGTGRIAMSSNRGAVVQSTPSAIAVPTATGTRASDPQLFTLTIASETKASRFYKWVNSGIKADAYALAHGSLPQYPVSFYSSGIKARIEVPKASDFSRAKYLPLDKLKKATDSAEVISAITATGGASRFLSLLQTASKTRRASTYYPTANFRLGVPAEEAAVAAADVNVTANAVAEPLTAAALSDNSTAVNGTAVEVGVNGTNSTSAIEDTTLIFEDPREFDVTQFAKDSRQFPNNNNVFDVGCNIDMSSLFSLNTKTSHTTEAHISPFAKPQDCFRGYISQIAVWRRELSAAEVAEWSYATRRFMTLAYSKYLSTQFLDEIPAPIRANLVGLFIAHDIFMEFGESFIASANAVGADTSKRPITKWKNVVPRPTKATTTAEAEIAKNYVEYLTQTRTTSLPVFVDGIGVYFDGDDDYLVSSAALSPYSHENGVTISVQATTTRAFGIPQTIISFPSKNIPAASLAASNPLYQCTQLGPDLALGIDLAERESERKSVCEWRKDGNITSAGTLKQEFINKLVATATRLTSNKKAAAKGTPVVSVSKATDDTVSKK